MGKMLQEALKRPMAERAIDKPDATILMTEPGGRKSAIRVFRTDKGTDIVFSRSSQGELLVMLPAYAAKQLGEALLSLSDVGGAGQ